MSACYGGLTELGQRGRDTGQSHTLAHQRLLSPGVGSAGGVLLQLLHAACCLPLVAGRAVGLSLAALVAGILLGAGLNAWLRVDIVPIGVSVN